MSLWDWLLAAWIYDELFDDDPDNRSCDDTRDYDSSYDYDDYEEDSKFLYLYTQITCRIWT